MDEMMVLWFLYKADQYQLSEESMSLWLDLIGFWHNETDEEAYNVPIVMLPRLSLSSMNEGL